MRIFSNQKVVPYTQKVSLALAFIFLAEAVCPAISFALTSGPAAPEFSSFEPVTTTNMVNEFSGDFSYNIPVLNIPGANGGGYALSLSYHAGESVESEASWVGYGWTLNPGAINRSKKGYADDTKNKRTYYNDVPANWTVSTGASVGNLEAFSFNVPLSANASIRYNNYRGFGYTAGAGLSFRQGLVSLGYSVSDGSGSFSAQVNPAALLTSDKKRKELKDKQKKYYEAKTPAEKDAALAAYRSAAKKSKKERRQEKALGVLGAAASSYGMYSLSDQQHATSVAPYSGQSFNTNFNLQTNPSPVEVGPQFGFTGNFNRQKNETTTQLTAYGYLYSSDAYGDGNGVMDYALEKESTFNKRDRYLSIPFSNADAFSISGEGLGGGFRFHSYRSGHFRPNTVESVTTIGQVSGDVCLGLEFGAGFNVGLGQQTLRVNGDDWGYGGSGNTSGYRFASKDDSNVPDRNESFFLRFNGDLGGDVDFGNDGIAVASIDQDGWVPGAKAFHPQLNSATVKDKISSQIRTSGNPVERSGRSSYIGYHTNAEMANAAYTYEKSTTILTNGTVDRSQNPEQIAEISTVNEDGNRYVYGLPINVKNETNLQYDVKGASAINNNFQVIKDISSFRKKIGEVDNGMYCNGYLLTQITTPDYVDLTQNGPTPDDYGGYTKFEYERVYSVANGTGYHYRMPYNGLQYSKGDLSDPTDDMGSYSSGNKDVYYLKRIVTKTHIATFFTNAVVTGSSATRADGLDAASDATAANSATAKGSKTLKKLDYIELRTVPSADYPSGKLTKKVVFKYDYSLCSGIPNATGSNGKLTLKALWFESEGIVNAKVSPYQFKYNYPDINTLYPTKYRADFKVGYDNAILTTANQNPAYSPFAIDAWGNYQDAGAVNLQRYLDMKTWVNQTPATTFDPAAWQLKVIQLPSGGEIHVQYEQDDYLYVQDRRATSLVSLTSSSDPLNEASASSGLYTLNVADIGVTTDAEKQELVTLINQNLNGQKIYFKFLYALIGSMQSNPINACNSDYVTGYVDFQRAQFNATAHTVEIIVGDNGSNGGYSLPRKVCLDLVKKQKGGKLNENGNCNAADAGVQEGLDTKSMVKQLINKIGTSFFADATSCKEIKPSLSYFKIPVLKPKKGGGLRVKRILMYDANGIDYGPTSAQDGTAALYGTEYFYQDELGKSSGVATNEPATIREENALVTCLAKRSEQGLFNKAVAGVDREQFEGPIGENLLPGPSVGYARVVSKNIHSGKTGMGFNVSEFYTVKDYPFDMNYTALNAKGVEQTGIELEKDWLNLPAIITNINVSNVWASQGYRFILNSMNGQPKSVGAYAGDFTSGTTGPISLYAKSSSTTYEYFQPGEKVNVALTADATPQLANPGKETEMVFEIKQVEDISDDASIEIDFGVGIAGIIPLPQASASPLVNYTESKMRTHVTSKVIQYPVIQKAVVTTKDGISSRTENLVFSAQTGKPIKTKTTDGYDGLTLGSPGVLQNGIYTSYTTPAYSQYKEMSQKAISERYIIRPGYDKFANITMNYVNGGVGTGPIYIDVKATTGNLCDAMAAFTVGDLIRVNEHASAYFYISRIEGSRMYLTESAFYIQGLLTTAVSSVEIVKSSKTNQLNTVAGQYVTYGAEQTPVVTPANPAVTTQWNNFISALNNAVNAGGGTIPIAPYSSYVVNNDPSCSPLTNNLTVQLSTNLVKILSNMTGGPLIQNGNFSSYEPGCVAQGNNAFNRGCISNWTQTNGYPQFNLSGPDGDDGAVQTTWWQAGVMQQVNLSPYKQYTLSFKARRDSYNFNVAAMLANANTSGLPTTGGIPVPAPGQTLYSTTVSSPTYVTYSTTFTPVEGNNQLYIYATSVTDAGYLYIDDVNITETGCTTSLYTNSARGPGYFGYNESGQILYYSPDNPCSPQVVQCFKFCNPNPSYKSITNVITANAKTFSGSWYFNGGRGNPFETGEYGKWREEKSYVYNAPIIGGSNEAASERNYKNAGVFTMRFFNWKDPNLNSPTYWINSNTVTKYSVNGDVTEEKDALGIYSSARYGYNTIVPYAIATNSPYDFMKYESFENMYTYNFAGTNYYYFEENATAVPAQYIRSLTAPIAHSGVGSYKVNDASGFSLRPFVADSRLDSKSISLKLWVKDPARSGYPVDVQLIGALPAGSQSLYTQKIAQSGEWTLYEGRSSGLLANCIYYFKIMGAQTGVDVYIDDVRQQPMDAKASAFIYDPSNLRLLTSFDDQHFGLYYRYNGEGKLISKMIETEKGMKTVTETQYNTPLITRP